MQTNLASWIRDTPEGEQAEEILRRCVHCGFCQATCPTYQELGDELDSPRGRIYLIKQMLEGEDVSASTQMHLDRCLTCRNCETTCPSGVEYGKLVDIGRAVVAKKVERPLRDRLLRIALRYGLNSPLFGPAMALGRVMRPILPATLRSKVVPVQPSRPLPENLTRHVRQAIMLQGCVQPAMMPSIDEATVRVLDAVGIGVRSVPGSVCCGAINLHLDAQEKALDQMRTNIDVWWPLLDTGQAECIVANASGCGAMLREYAHHLRNDPRYATKAQELSDAVRDVAELLEPHAAELGKRIGGITGRHAFHPPCTLQHWQKLRGITEKVLADLGFQLQPFAESHLCCGSAGTYSITQKELSQSLRDRKLSHIEATQPDIIVSSNMGCITHLQSGASVSVRHWVEVVDEALAGI
ncbi:glycolate oxidase subunit GlcF [Achromobacter sp. F4_2707]|uniref:glycolate oxidase subunit GlcF n=1 Tax=Achromobacter sp. F4_2707 TaxID=3114286 RepID=UPI0039C6A718